LAQDGGLCGDWRERSYRPDQRYEHVSGVVVSPHFDDAVFSTAHVLLAAGPAATVVTVCGGAPAEGEVSEWDLECGFPSGSAAAAGRAAEDLRAAEIAGVRSVHLGVPDEPYRAGFPNDRVVADLAAILPPCGDVWVPAGLGSHPDHVSTREAVLEVLPAANPRIRFYADCPYAFAFGWDAADTGRAPTHRWGMHLARIEQYFGHFRAHTIRLSDDAVASKLAMVSCHRSQVDAMLPEFPMLTDPDGPLRTERYWAARPA
jgi:LmbE family N-acetylglucosaminyl deacetylase